MSSFYLTRGSPLQIQETIETMMRLDISFDVNVVNQFLNFVIATGMLWLEF